MQISAPARVSLNPEAMSDHARAAAFSACCCEMAAVFVGLVDLFYDALELGSVVLLPEGIGISCGRAEPSKAVMRHALVLGDDGKVAQRVLKVGINRMLFGFRHQAFHPLALFFADFSALPFQHRFEGLGVFLNAGDRLFEQTA